MFCYFASVDFPCVCTLLEYLFTDDSLLGLSTFSNFYFLLVI